MTHYFTRPAMLFALLLMVPVASAAVDFEQWPRPQDAREFARLDDKLPAVLTYFSRQSQQQLQQFYLDALGAPAEQKSRYGQLELVYVQAEQQIRLIISEQQDWRQVDMMVQATSY